MSLFAIIAIGLSAPFVTSLDDGAAKQPAPAAAPVADTTSPTSSAAEEAAKFAPAKKQSTGTGALSDLVAQAIRAKLDRAAKNRATGGTITLPGSNTSEPFDTGTLPGGMGGASFGPGMQTPQPDMMTGGTRVMMGAPGDGNAAYTNIVPSGQRAESGTNPAPAVNDSFKSQSGTPAASAESADSGSESAASAAQPGANHNLLDIFVGTWDVSANFDTGPGQPPETASGQMVNSWQLEGRWLKQEYAGQMASLGAFRGIGYLGYDNLQKSFVGTWMDTLSTSCIVSKGAFDQNRATFTLGGEFTAPGGAKFTQKQVITILSPDRYVVTMYLTGPDGVEFKTGNLEYTRSIKSITNASVR